MSILISSTNLILMRVVKSDLGNEMFSVNVIVAISKAKINMLILSRKITD